MSSEESSYNLGMLFVWFYVTFLGILGFLNCVYYSYMIYLKCFSRNRYKNTDNRRREESFDEESFDEDPLNEDPKGPSLV